MNLIKIFISTFFLLVSLISLGQHNYINYYNKTNEAEYRLLCNNVALAKKTYADAFKMVKKPFGKDIYMMAKIFAIENKLDSAYIYLCLAAKSVIPFFYSNIEHDTIWNNLFSQHPEFKRKLIEIDSLKLNKEDNDKQYIETQKMITYFRTEDQLYRKEFTKVEEMGYDSSTTVYKEALSKMMAQDAKIQKEVIAYVEQNGYPGLLQVGSDIMNVVLLHFSKENVKLIKPILLKGIEEGNIYPMEMAIMIDRIEYSFENKCGFSIYSMDYCKESDWPEIIKRRLELGLGAYLGGYGRDVDEKREVFPWVGKLIN